MIDEESKESNLNKDLQKTTQRQGDNDHNDHSDDSGKAKRKKIAIQFGFVSLLISTPAPQTTSPLKAPHT